MKKGDILTAVHVEEEGSGTVVRTDTGEVLGILSARGVKVGQKMQVGPVCGDWCRVFLMGDAFQARILEAATHNDAVSGAGVPQAPGAGRGA